MAFGLTLKNKTDRQLKLPDLLAAMVADGLISQDQHKQLSSRVRPKDIENTHPICLIAGQLWPDKRTGQVLNEECISQWLAEVLGLQYVRIDPLKTDVQLVTSLASFGYSSKHHILPIAVKDEVVIFATCEPLQQSWVGDLTAMIGKTIRVVITTPSDIDKYTLEFYALAKSVEKANQSSAINVPGVNNLEQLVQLGESGNLDANDQHIVHIVDWLMQFAFQQRASDIHLEPRREISHVRFRIDGMMHLVYEVSTSIMTAIISRIKSLGGMDVVDRRRPQDGRVKIRAPQGSEVELRLSTLPTAFGEKMVMRIFDPDILIKEFTQLGFSERNGRLWKGMTKQSSGLVLVTGPTGSGKTTTLYSTLKYLSTPQVNICSIEDPIELIDPSFNQTQINPTVNLHFHNGIKALLRQDPDVMMIGEIRDLETAKAALHASLTGHLVLSSLHTSNVVATVTRLMEIGIADYLLRSTLIGVVAQRLLRTLCPHCLYPGEVDRDIWKSLTRPLKVPHPKTVNLGRGCLECRNTSYLGRIGIYEMLQVTERFRSFIRIDADHDELFEVAVRDGMVPLSAGGAMQVAAGLTTPAEVMRVVNMS